MVFFKLADKYKINIYVNHNSSLRNILATELL